MDVVGDAASAGSPAPDEPTRVCSHHQYVFIQVVYISDGVPNALVSTLEMIDMKLLHHNWKVRLMCIRSC